MHYSEFAAKLVCKHCGQPNRSDDWPLRGDQTPLYHQDEPGTYQVVVHCPHCGEDWYVVWDQDPGPIRPLDAAAEPLEADGAVVKNNIDLYASDTDIPAGTLGVVKRSYPGGAVVVEFPSLSVEGQWTDDVFTEATPSEAAALRKGSEPREGKPWWKFW